MEVGVSNGEHGDDILSISGEFSQLMRESKRGGSDGSVLCNGPLPSILDNLSGLNRSKREFKVSELLDLELIICRRELSTEDGVQTDGFPSDNILPLRVWEFRTTGGVGERS